MKRLSKNNLYCLVRALSCFWISSVGGPLPAVPIRPFCRLLVSWEPGVPVSSELDIFCRQQWTHSLSSCARKSAQQATFMRNKNKHSAGHVTCIGDTLQAGKARQFCYICTAAERWVCFACAPRQMIR